MHSMRDEASFLPWYVCRTVVITSLRLERLMEHYTKQVVSDLAIAVVVNNALVSMRDSGARSDGQ